MDAVEKQRVIARLKAEADADFAAGQVEGIKDGTEAATDMLDLRHIEQVVNGAFDVQENESALVELLCEEYGYECADDILDNSASYVSGWNAGFAVGVTQVWAQVIADPSWNVGRNRAA